MDAGAWGAAAAGRAALLEGGEKVAAAARLCELQVWSVAFLACISCLCVVCCVFRRSSVLSLSLSMSIMQSQSQTSSLVSGVLAARESVTVLCAAVLLAGLAACVV